MENKKQIEKKVVSGTVRSTETVDSTVILKELLKNKNSPLFLSKNINRIKRYLYENGIHIEKRAIKGILASVKSNSQITNNSSRRKTAEIGKIFETSQQFGRILHSDILVLSKLRKYRTNKYLILTLVDGLSNYILLDLLSNNKAETVINSLNGMIERTAWLPKGKKTIITDMAREYRGNVAKNWAKLNNVKFSMVRYRLYRKSKGSTPAERANRRIRKVLESLVTEKGDMNFDALIKLCERTLNNEFQPILKMSALSTVKTQDPRYVSLLKISTKFSKRKYLRNEAFNVKPIALYSIVRIKRFKDKELISKESYGMYSESLFLIIAVEESNLVNYYRLGTLFKLEPLGKCTYSSAELLLTDLSYSKACYIQSTENMKVIRKLGNGLIEFSPFFDSVVFLGPERLLSI